MSDIKQINRICIKGHGFSMTNADHVSLGKTPDKVGKELIWQKGYKSLAKYTKMPEGHRFVSLFDDKGNEDKFILYEDNIYRVYNGKAKPLEKGSHFETIENIATESDVMMKHSEKNFSLLKFQGYSK